MCAYMFIRGRVFVSMCVRVCDTTLTFSYSALILRRPFPADRVEKNKENIGFIIKSASNTNSTYCVCSAKSGKIRNTIEEIYSVHPLS